MTIYSLHGMRVTLTRHPRKCGGGREGGEEGGEEERDKNPAQPIGAACGLWVMLRVSVKCV